MGKKSGLIPRSVLFGNPDNASPSLSPDGTQLAFLAPVNGVLNVWVGPADNPAAAKPVTDDRGRGIRAYFWAFTNQHILFIQDKAGDENWHIFAKELPDGAARDLTPFEGVLAQVMKVEHDFPDEILVSLNNRDARYHDVHRLNIRTGELRLVQENREFGGFLVDDAYSIRFAERFTADGGYELLKPAGGGRGWEPWMKVSTDDFFTTGIAGFDKAGMSVYLRDSRGRDTAALAILDLATGTERVLADDPRVDVGSAIMHPTEKHAQAVAIQHERVEWRILDDSIAADFACLKTVADGDLWLASRTLDDRQWIVAFSSDSAPVRYYRYDRTAKQAQFLFSTHSRLEGQPLAKMHPVTIKSRDGFDLVCYLTLPGKSKPGAPRPAKPVPLVLNVHGGPWGRNGWGLDPEHQWLANRGYAVLSVNFRGSTGFGKKFVNASNLEWGGKMHDDLIDAVDWAVREKIADPKRVAIFGWSYGGYAALVGMTFTPEVFACGVEGVGISNLVTFLETIPPYWQPWKELWATRVGDLRTEAGRKLLVERSPLSRVDAIRRPLLIGHGANDPRVKKAEADQIANAMQAKGIPVTYLLYPDEGHGFARPENRLSFYAVAEAFLAANLGGKAQPVGDDFKGSSAQIVCGKERVAGLE